MSPLVRRVPKRGFHNADALIVGSVNVGDLEAAFNAGDVVDRDTLKEKNVLKGRYDILKVLGDGELTKKLKVSAHRFSASAKEKLDRVGCEINILTERTPVIEKQKAARAAKKK
jgi:large subunit ribosomal protein L15